MEEHENDMKRKINLIQDLFACELVQVADDHSAPATRGAKNQQEMVPDQELLEFLDEREELREQMYDDLSIDSYLQSYDKLCQYGLEEYFMELLKWDLNINMGNDLDEFFSPEFELRFKDHQELLDLAEFLNKVQSK